MKLLVEALMKFACGLLLVGLLIFLPAGTLDYGYGWLLMAVLFGPMLIAGFVMFFKTPDFLAKRLDAKEKQATQKGVLALSGLMFIGGFVVAGLDNRFGWSHMPEVVVAAAAVLFMALIIPGAWFLMNQTKNMGELCCSSYIGRWKYRDHYQALF